MTRTTLIAAALAAGLTVPALADNKSGPGPDWMPQEQVVQKLGAAGYGNITRLNADDGHWEAKAVKDGKIVEVSIDPRSGAIVEENEDD